MKLIQYTFLLAIAAMIWGCQSDGKSSTTTPNSHYNYKVYSAGDGVKPKPGNYVYFQFDIYNDKDSLLQTYRNQAQTPSVKIPPAGDAALKMNPVVDALSVLSVGDSVGIIMPRDSIKNLPPGFDDVDHFLYNIVVKEIVEDSVYMSRLKEEQRIAAEKAQVIMARYDDVEALAQKTIKDYNRNRLKTQTTPNGVKYIVHEQGTGTVPTPGSVATMQYYGALTKDGTFFDSSFKRGSGFSFKVGAGSVIKGWDEAIPMFPSGTKASIFIPSDMGYGANGAPPTIPGGAELYFYVEVEDVSL